MTARIGRIRIVGKAPPSAVNARGMRIGFMASLADFEVSVIDEEGNAIPITAHSVRFEVAADNEAARAFLEVFPDEVDVEALGRITVEPRPDSVTVPPDDAELDELERQLRIKGAALLALQDNPDEPNTYTSALDAIRKLRGSA